MVKEGAALTQGGDGGGRGPGRYREEARKDTCDDRLDPGKMTLKEKNQVKKLPDTWLNHFPAMASSIFLSSRKSFN